MLKRVCVVPVCYNAYEDAARFLGALERAFEKSPGIHLDVVLSDNSTIAFPAGFDVRQYLFNYSYLKNANIGYFPAFNRAMGVVPVGPEAYDFVVVCNVDLVVAEDFFLVLGNQTLTSNIGLIAPGIFSDKDGRDLNPKIKRRPKATKINFMRVVCSNATLFRWYGKLVRMRERARARARERQLMQDRKFVSTQKMYGAHGSFMIFTKNYFLHGASVDYPRFLFGEEVFVAEQLRMRQLDIDHIPELRIYDREHASTSKVNLGFICGEHKKSYDYLYAHFFKGRHQR